MTIGPSSANARNAHVRDRVLPSAPRDGFVLGFVEDNDPDDPLAWCNDCEQMYLREQDWTEAFKRFTDLKVVCDVCYANLKELHSTTEGRKLACGSLSSNVAAISTSLATRTANAYGVSSCLST